MGRAKDRLTNSMFDDTDEELDHDAKSSGGKRKAEKLVGAAAYYQGRILRACHGAALTVDEIRGAIGLSTRELTRKYVMDLVRQGSLVENRRVESAVPVYVTNAD